MQLGVRVLAAPDKFRGTATADEVCAAIAAAVESAGGTCVTQPMADGGEGTLAAFGGANRSAVVTGPLGDPVTAGWRLREDGLAVIEAAQANGLLLAGGSQGNDPVAATSRGVGELIAAAIHAGAARVLVGLGGSASTDGGMGAVTALTERGMLSAATVTPIEVCCDVDTRFTDAARIFGPQKGADPTQIAQLTVSLRNQRSEYLRRFGMDVESLPGSGAAGGLAGGLAAIGATLVSGFGRIADELGLDALIRNADVVITGEGSFDATSLTGKVVGGVARLAQAAGVPVVAVVGVVDERSAAQLPDELRVVVSLTGLFGKDRSRTDTAAAVRDAVAGYLSKLRQR